jgi:3-hydroxybutyryl-CoA dehydrogenase
MKVGKVGVAGAGLMGSGIIQVTAQAGHEVVYREVTQDLVKKGRGRIEKFLAKAVEKGKTTAEERDRVLGRITGTTDVGDLADCDLVIEAIVENIEAKNELFGALDGQCPETTVFASNTSSLSITEMARGTGRPDRFVGIHFFNPVPVMPLVEVVRALKTSDETYATARAFAEGLGKTVVSCGDSPGFVVNRLLVPYLLDAIRVYEAGLATREDIDAGMKLGCGHPMGPLTLSDFVGLDTTLYIAEIMFDAFREPRFAPPPLLKRMVAAGLLGRKSGEGFYEYGG